MQVLAKTLLTTPEISTGDRVFDLWTTSAGIANGAFVVLATIGAMAASGHETFQTRYTVKEVLPRLALAFLAANLSFHLCGRAITLANALSGALLGPNVDPARATATLQRLIVPPADSEAFYILLALVAIILLVLLLIAFIMRTALVLVLVVAAPLALAGYTLPFTEGLARFWWRAFGGLLLIQVAQSLTLVVAVRAFFNQDGRLLVGIAPSGQLVNLLLTLCLLIILVRIPSWISQRIFAPSRGRSSTIARLVRYAVAYRLMSPVLNVLRPGRGHRGGRRGGQGGSGRGGRSAAAAAVPAAAAARAGSGNAFAGTAAAAARGGPGPIKHAPVGARRPPPSYSGAPVPIKHAPGAPPYPGKYRPTPKPPGPVPPTHPVYGYPRETYYANGPAGLGQMYWLRSQAAARQATPPQPARPRQGEAPPPARRSTQPPPTPKRPSPPPLPHPRPRPGTGRPGRTGRDNGGESR
ncbi:hypothetical protein DP939_42215 [Spongiactinospora rosea]|uniref:TrbL/VirB6 plasmid conjugal transfer protein n=1 Tax=Spongiactinospora rosea TaxID=2248750 RepID=A0A366LJV4_9ACTN|nr:hypothetical protein DP939_42215 [Spongiactinospora rosea]